MSLIKDFLKLTNGEIEEFFIFTLNLADFIGGVE